MNTNDYMTVQRLLGRLEGLATMAGEKRLENEIYDILETLDATIDRYAPKDAAAAADHQNKSTEEEALKGFHAIKAFCKERKVVRCKERCPFWPACQVWGRPPQDWPELKEVKTDDQ